MTKLRNTLAAATLLGALAVPLAAHAGPCDLEISGNDVLQYDKHELAAPASCKKITVTLHHIGKQPREAMGHDWVLVKTKDLAAVDMAGLSAGLANDYVAPGDKRVLARTSVIGGGQTTSITFSASILSKGGDYSYLCTFPGHSALMHGKFKFG